MFLFQCPEKDKLVVPGFLHADTEGRVN